MIEMEYHNFHKQQKQLKSFTLKSIKQLQTILQKPLENRLSADYNILNKFINQLQFFQYLSQHTMSQVSKYMIKWGKVVHIPSSRVVTEAKKLNHSLFILLSGGIGIANNKLNNVPILMKKQSSKINLLIQKGFKYVKKNHFSAKIFNKQQARSPIKNNFNKVQLTDYDFTCKISTQKAIGFQDQLVGQQYLSTTVTLKDSIFLQIRNPYVMDSLNFYKNVQIDEKIKIFYKSTQIFCKFPYDKLRLLMQKSQSQQLCKGQYLYKQGQKSEHFYILKEGQITLKKSIKLFKQDPNRFYKNRKSMKGQKGQPMQNLSYTNFEQVYNYQPQQKIVDLGIINGITLFGQQQVMQNKQRQVSAKVTSIFAQVYLLSFKLLQNILIQRKNDVKQSFPKISFQNFKRQLYDKITNKKILYRQQKLSEMINIHNKLNMNYFFIQEDQKNKQQDDNKSKLLKNSPCEQNNQIKIDKITENKNMRRSFRKFNRQLYSITNSIKENNNHKHNHSSENQIQIQSKQNYFLTAVQIDEDFFQPTYNRFNFAKFKQKSKNPQHDLNLNLSQQQHSLANMTHTVSLINKKVEQVCARGQKLGIKKYSININNPLFELQYFKRQRSQSLRIQNEKRKRVYNSVSKLNVTTATSISKSRVASTRPHSASTTFRTFKKYQQ